MNVDGSDVDGRDDDLAAWKFTGSPGPAAGAGPGPKLPGSSAEDPEPGPSRPPRPAGDGRRSDQSQTRSRLEARRRRTRLSRWSRWTLLVIVVGGLLIGLSGYYWINSEANPSGPPGVQVVVQVPDGEGSTTLVGTLHSMGVMGSPLAYRLWSQIHGAPGLVPGAYAFSRNSSFSAVQNILANGPNVLGLQNPAGFTVGELSQRVGQISSFSEAQFHAEVTDGSVRSPWDPPPSTNLEGLLAPGNYIVTPGESSRQLAEAMVNRFNATARGLHLAAGAARLGLTPYQLITVASIVQKEGVIPSNMGRVARVILNRLAQGKPLQMDSTVLYALGRDGGPVTSADLAYESPYNTYLHHGLTPTPTCFPSVDALRAALNPPAGSWLYFVVVANDGTEAFSTTYAGQLANERLARSRGVG